MEKVASHINEMQKIYEDYGSVFDQLVAEQAGHDKEVHTHSQTIIIITLFQHFLKGLLVETLKKGNSLSQSI